MKCDQYTEGQEAVCHTCGMRWDLNDKDKHCGKEPLSRKEISKRLKQLKEKL